jgi:hypothetical protein
MAALFLLRGRVVVLAIASAVGLMVLALVLLGPALSHVAATSSNPLVQHQATGLGNPLSESGSTLPTHARAFVQGVLDGVRHPLGQGTGISTIAADKLGNGTGRTLVQLAGTTESIRGTDTDVSNVFLSFGILGGLIYVAMLIIIARRVVIRYARSRDPLVLAVIGLMVVTSLEWLTGGRYFAAALTWFVFGWASRREPVRTPAPVTPPTPTWSR